MASNGETGALLLAASVRACVSVCVCVLMSVCVCVCVGGTGCLAVRGEEQTDERRRRRRRKRRGAQRGEGVWVPEYYRSETWRQSNPSIFNASVETVHIRCAVMFVCFIQ